MTAEYNNSNGDWMRIVALLVAIFLLLFVAQKAEAQSNHVGFWNESEIKETRKSQLYYANSSNQLISKIVQYENPSVDFIDATWTSRDINGLSWWRYEYFYNVVCTRFNERGNQRHFVVVCKLKENI